MSEQVIVTMDDIRKLRYCSRGARAWFMAHDLDWVAFLRHGISSEQLQATGDEMAMKAIEVARGRQK